MTSYPWPVLPLSALAEVRLGRQRSPKNHAGSQMRPYLRAANVGWNGLILDDVKEMNFTDDEMATYALRPGDLLLGEASGSPGEVGKPALWKGELAECAFQNTLLRVRSEIMEPGFLLHFFRHMALSGRFVEQSRGVGIHHLGRERLAKWPTPQPPMQEQRRIVAILEEHFSDLDDGMASLNRARTRSTAFLAAAVADEFDRLPGGERLLGDLAEGVKNGIFVSRARAEADGVPILRIGAVRPLRLDLSDLRYSAQSAEALAAGDALLAPGDVLFTRYNGNPRYVGACAVVPNGIAALTWPDKLIRVRLRADTADPGFVAYACSFGRGRRAIEASLKTSAGQVGISGRELRNIRIRVPRLAIQREVGERLACRAEDADRLEGAADASSRRATSLRRAVLAAAFSGRLTGHGSDTDVIKELAEEESA